ncbi:hypothetical protein EVAR_61117_1 [Eumeta japonica]|uniref:Uncharacterized protein n=1 Tax=Eumeta variegata TaxID=151549 RepID=A0A4C1ZF55_EUMVA|nr:hypothetical protein EVAR_61117_1 [Eumeta japonica]
MSEKGYGDLFPYELNFPRMEFLPEYGTRMGVLAVLRKCCLNSKQFIGRVGKGRLKKSYAKQFTGIIKKGQVLSTQKRRACMRLLMDISEARDVSKDRTMWKSGVSTFPSEEAKKRIFARISSRVDIELNPTSFISTDDVVNHNPDLVHAFDSILSPAYNSSSGLNLDSGSV